MAVPPGNGLVQPTQMKDPLARCLPHCLQSLPRRLESFHQLGSHVTCQASEDLLTGGEWGLYGVLCSRVSHRLFCGSLVLQDDHRKNIFVVKSVMEASVFELFIDSQCTLAWTCSRLPVLIKKKNSSFVSLVISKFVWPQNIFFGKY